MFSRVYLDYNATTPLHPTVQKFVVDNLSKFGNPSSVHWAGRETKKILTEARHSISQLLHCDPLEIIFTATGSEGNNLALKGALAPLLKKRPSESRSEIVCSTVEHPSVLKTVLHLEQQGFKIRWLNVSLEGAISFEELDGLLSEKTALVTVQLVNNETGSILPIKKIARRAHQVGALMHSDMVQGLGKIPMDLAALDVDLATFAGHKFYSLKGAAFLFVKRGTQLETLISGGGQERSRRAGTENALAIGSLGEAARVLGPELAEQSKRLSAMRDGLEKRILAEISGCRGNGVGSLRVPNTTNVTFENVDGETLLINLDTQGFAVSSGAACSSGSQEPSPVLTAMGLSSLQASQSLRISLGWLTTEDEVNQFFDALKSSVSKMRATLSEMQREAGDSDFQDQVMM